MQLSRDGWSVSYSEASHSLVFCGAMLDPDTGVYDALCDFLELTSQKSSASITWDVSALADISSAGLGAFYAFARRCREKAGYALKIKADAGHYWQERHLTNVYKILPGTVLEFVR